jgi:hypothetical protein
MEKNKLDGFINRYSLGGEIECVIVTSKEKEVSAKIISDDKSLLGEVTAFNVDIPDGSYPIYTTSQFKQLLSVLDDDVKVEQGVGSVKLSDSTTSINYMLATESVIPTVPPLKTLPTFNVEVKLGTDVINRFVKSKGALTESDTFTFSSKNGVSQLILGYSTVNTNRISINVNATTDGDVDPISFSAKYLKQILLANKSSNDAILKISTEGLSFVSFSDSDYSSTYYLVQQK